MINVSITIEDQNVRAIFNKVLAKLNDSPKLLEKNARMIILGSIRENIKSQSNIVPSNDGTKFKILSERYKNSKAFKNRPRNSQNPLDTQNFIDSFYVAPMSSVQSQQSGLAVTSRHPGAFTHTKGLTVNIFGKTQYKFPERNGIWLSERAQQLIANNIQMELINATKS